MCANSRIRIRFFIKIVNAFIAQFAFDFGVSLAVFNDVELLALLNFVSTCTLLGSWCLMIELIVIYQTRSSFQTVNMYIFIIVLSRNDVEEAHAIASFSFAEGKRLANFEF